jgi:hypothetical protein
LTHKRARTLISIGRKEKIRMADPEEVRKEFAAALNLWFSEYNRRFFNDRLSGWTVTADDNHPGTYGYSDRKTKQIHVRFYTHRDELGMRATLIHEMAHAATNSGHGTKWRQEMERLRDAGAPTEPLDFLVPYSARDIVTSFIDVARSKGASWEEALSLWEPLAPRILRQAKKFYDLERARIAGEEAGRVKT